MKKVLLAAFTALSLAACNDAATDTTTASNDSANMSSDANNSEEAKEERNKQTALASIKAGNNGDMEAVYRDYDTDMVDYGEGSMAPVKNLDTAKAGFKTFQTAFPDWKGSDLVTVADGDYVMVYGNWGGTWKADIMGQKATGKSVTFKDVDIYKFNDAGKIIEHRAVQPINNIARQLGMKMPKQ